MEYTKYIRHKFPSPFFWSRKNTFGKMGMGPWDPRTTTTATADIEKTLEKGVLYITLGGFNHPSEKYGEVKLGSSFCPNFLGVKIKDI